MHETEQRKPMLMDDDYDTATETDVGLNEIKEKTAAIRHSFRGKIGLSIAMCEGATLT